MIQRPFALFDQVRILSIPQTEQMGIAGHVGQVQGITSLPSTGIQPIGGTSAAQAFKVVFGDQILTATSGLINTPDSSDELWFAPDVLEFVGTAPEIRISPVRKAVIRDASDNWVIQPGDYDSGMDSNPFAPPTEPGRLRKRLRTFHWLLIIVFALGALVTAAVIHDFAHFWHWW